jgi:hypothetical protein
VKQELGRAKAWMQMESPKAVPVGRSWIVQSIFKPESGIFQETVLKAIRVEHWAWCIFGWKTIKQTKQNNIFQ